MAFSISNVLAIIQNGVTAVNNLNIQLRGSLNAILSRFVTDEANIATLQATIAGYESAWTSYTPTVTASVGAFTTVAATGRYKQNGKVVNFWVNVVVTNAGTAAVATVVTLPVTASAAARGAFSGRENSVTGVGLTSILINTGQFVYQRYDGTFLGAAGMTFDVSGAYEAA